MQMVRDANYFSVFPARLDAAVVKGEGNMVAA
jgi:hypothetical protein